MARSKRLLAALAATVVIAVFPSCGGSPESEGPAGSSPVSEVPVITNPGTGEKIQLRLNLEEGKSYKARMVTDQQITVAGQKQPQSIGFGFTHHVKEVRDDGTAVVQITYDSVQFKQQGPTGSIEYDSANPPANLPAMAKGFAALVGQGFTMEVTPTGKVTKIEGAGEMISNMLKQMDMPMPSARATLEEKMKEQFGDDALREMMEQMTAIYPGEPVGIGGSWTKRMVVSKGFPIIMDNTWTLKSRQDGVAVVDVQSKVAPNPSAGPMDMGMVKIGHQLSGTQSGTLELDEATGWTLRSTLQQKLAGKMTVTGGPQGSQTAPISIDSTIRIDSPEEE